MTSHRARYGPDNPDETYVAHEFPEQLVDLGEVRMNYATAGEASSPALLLVPGQTESWWGYEAAMPRLAEHFDVFAVDLRGQGRSTRTPGLAAERLVSAGEPAGALIERLRANTTRLLPALRVGSH